jgi:hypothetical protein
MKPGTLSIFITLYFIGSLLYMLACPSNSHMGQANFYAWLRCSKYILIYGMIFILVVSNQKYIKFDLDKISLRFLKIYTSFQLIFYVFLLNTDLPTYIYWMDSKIIGLSIAILIFCFNIFLSRKFIIR